MTCNPLIWSIRVQLIGCRLKRDVAMLRLLLLSLLGIALVRPETALAQPAEQMLAARAEDCETVSELLTSGVDPDPPGIASPLYFAAQGGYLEIVEVQQPFSLPHMKQCIEQFWINAL